MIHDSDSGVAYTPWIGTDGEVGYRYQDAEGNTGYIYLNASGGSDDGVPTVFVYQGPHGNPALDAAEAYFQPDFSALLP